MNTILKKSLAVLDANLGRCPRCMRLSFIFMLGMWGLVLVMTWATNSPLVLTAARVIVVAATGLWFSHLTAFALRAMRSAGASKGKPVGRSVVADLPYPPRRQFVFAFAKSFLLAATATALPIQTAFAQSKMQQCLACCAAKSRACGNDAKCNVLYQNCVSNCNSQGETPSEWMCW